MKTKLYKTKAVDLEKYTTIELSFLLLDLCKEIVQRQKAAPKLIAELNKKTYDLTHEVELGNRTTRKAKADYYEVMEKHFSDRRMAKVESIVVEEVLGVIPFEPHKIISKLGQAVKQKQNYFHLSDGDKVIQPKTWEQFKKEHLDLYI